MNADVKKGFFIGIGVMAALLVVGFASGVVSKTF